MTKSLTRTELMLSRKGWRPMRLLTPCAGPMRTFHGAVMLGMLTQGCASDAANAFPLDAPDQQASDDSQIRLVASPTTAMHGDCEHALKNLRSVLSLPFPANVRAASASHQGDVVLALEYGGTPILRHVREGSDRHTDLDPLLPQAQRFISALSRIRNGQVLVAHHGKTSEPTWPLTVTAVELGSRRVRWSRVLRDLSGAPRPWYDDKGRRAADIPNAPELVRAIGHHIVHRADSRYSVLVRHEGGLDLYGFEADGTFRFRTVLVARSLPLYVEPDVAEQNDGSLSVVLNLNRAQRRAFEALHGFAWTEPLTDAPDTFTRPVVISISESGTISSIHDGLGPRGEAIPTGDLVGGAPTWVGERLIWFASVSPRHLMLSLERGAGEARAFTTPFAHRLDALRSAAVFENDVYVTGRIDGTDALKYGPSFLGRLTSDGTMPWHCRALTDDIVSYTGSYALHPGEVPLLSVRTNADAAKGSADESQRLRVYRLTRLGAPR